MRLNYISGKIPDPNSPLSMITGTSLNKLRTLKLMQWNEGRTIMPGWFTSIDSDSAKITSFIQHAPAKISGVVPFINYMDAGRFLREICDSDAVSAVMPPTLPAVISKPGYSVATAWPLASDMVATPVVARDVLTELGFTVPTSKYYDANFYRYDMSDVSLGAVLGPSAEDIFFIAQQFAPFGYGEAMLEMCQYNAHARNLTKFSALAGVRAMVLPNEYQALHEALIEIAPDYAAGTRTLADYIQISTGLSLLGRAQCLDPHLDTTGLSIQLYYAMMNPDYLHSMSSAHLISLVKADNTTGLAIVSMPSATTVGEFVDVRYQMPEEFLPHIETLETLTASDLTALADIRRIYKAVLIVRFLQYKGYLLSLLTTIKGVDREEFFTHLL